jgi:hypothetical protein
MEGKNRPLALNPWDSKGHNSYAAAINAVDEILDPEKDAGLHDNPQLLEFMKLALYERITSQSQANYVQYQLVKPILTDRHDPYIHGDKTPSELTLFLQVTDRLQSIEIARRTSRHWNMYREADRPVRSDLDEHPLLYTKSLKSEPLYRVKNLNINDPNDQHFVQIDRKRTVRQHFGGAVLTIVRNSLVLHDAGGTMPKEIRQFIDEQRELALDQSRREAGTDYDYDMHSDLLRDHLEDHVTHRSNNVQPSWAIPIATGYYAAKREFVKTKQLIPKTD